MGLKPLPSPKELRLTPYQRISSGMGDHPNKADARGAPATGPRDGTPLEGKPGNLPHERSEEAATLIRELSGYGMPQEEISRVLNATYGGGYSVDTLDRHYRAELDAALASRKSELLRRAHKIAMGEDVLTKVGEDGKVVPSGVSPDAAFRESAAQLRWLLGAVHRVRDGMEHDFGAGTINVSISADDAEL